MSELHHFVQHVPHGAQPDACARDGLRLTFAEREKSRQRATLASGEAITIGLPRGTLMRGGDSLVTADGRQVTIVAADEAVSTVTASDLVKVAYHLGNRHVSLQIGDGWLRYLKDHVLDAMVAGLGGHVQHEQAPFEPESGAYGHHHHD